MSTIQQIQESIRSQLGLEPEETNEPPEGMKAWLSEFEPDMHASLYQEDEDEEYLDEASGSGKFDEFDARRLVERAFLKADGISLREYQGPEGIGQTSQATKARIVVTRALKAYLDALRSGRR